ncbi:MAG: cysteine protease [Ilumatobacteraceae bacterium]|nr:cysteine protease [Ilumatobacteraceae bacterium]
MASNGRPPGELSVEPLWQHCVNAGAASHFGTTVAAVAGAVATMGQPDERVWPYDLTLGAGSQPAPQAAASADFHTAALFTVPLVHDGIEQYIEATLGIGLPMVLVVELTPEFEHPAAGGEIRTPALNAAIGDYHAVTAVGVSTDSTGTTRRLLVRNSWGPGWGAGGHGWLPLDYLVAFAVEAAAIDPSSLGLR